MAVEPRRRDDGRLAAEPDPLDGLNGRSIRQYRGLYAVPMNSHERALCRRAMREYVRRHGASPTASVVLELLERAPSLELLERTLTLSGPVPAPVPPITGAERERSC